MIDSLIRFLIGIGIVSGYFYLFHWRRLRRERILWHRYCECKEDWRRAGISKPFPTTWEEVKRDGKV